MTQPLGTFTLNSPEPTSLYDILTGLRHSELPPTSLAVSLLRTLSRAVIRAQRNAQQLYRVAARARDLCDGLNCLLVLISNQENDNQAMQDFEKFLEALETVESNTHRVLLYVDDEWQPLSEEGMWSWEENSAAIERIARAFHVPKLEVIAPAKLNWEEDLRGAKLCDQMQWLSSISASSLTVAEWDQRIGKKETASKSLQSLQNTLASLDDQQMEPAVVLVIYCVMGLFVTMQSARQPPRQPEYHAVDTYQRFLQYVNSSLQSGTESSWTELQDILKNLVLSQNCIGYLYDLNLPFLQDLPPSPADSHSRIATYSSGVRNSGNSSDVISYHRGLLSPFGQAQQLQFRQPLKHTISIPGHSGMPPGADPQLWTWFQSVNGDGSGNITVEDLQKLLINGNWTPLDLTTVTMLMGLFDTDRSGTIAFEEFVALWKYTADWQHTFRHFDRDQSGCIDGDELAAAIRLLGFSLSPNLIHLLEQKYASVTTTSDARGGITFNYFIRACVAVKTATETFKRIDTDNDGWINIDYEEFMRIALITSNDGAKLSPSDIDWSPSVPRRAPIGRSELGKPRKEKIKLPKETSDASDSDPYSSQSLVLQSFYRSLGASDAPDRRKS